MQKQVASSQLQSGRLTNYYQLDVMYYIYKLVMIPPVESQPPVENRAQLPVKELAKVYDIFDVVQSGG